jgi:hypothetical protein
VSPDTELFLPVTNIGLRAIDRLCGSDEVGTLILSVVVK